MDKTLLAQLTAQIDSSAGWKVLRPNMPGLNCTASEAKKEVRKAIRLGEVPVIQATR